MNTGATERTYDEDIMPLLRRVQTICAEMQMGYVFVFDLHDADKVAQIALTYTDSSKKLHALTALIKHWDVSA